MSHSTTTFGSFSIDRVSLKSDVTLFLRRWLASETIANPNALAELGLATMVRRR